MIKINKKELNFLVKRYKWSDRTQNQNPSTQFTGARPRRLGWSLKRSQAVSLRLMALLSCSGEARDIGSKRVRRALLRMGALHNVSEPEQAEEDLPGGQQGKNKMSLEYLLCHNARQCSKNIWNMSKRHRSQCKGAPTGQIKAMLRPSSCFPKAGWFLSVFGQWEAEFGLTVKSVARGFFPTLSLRQSPALGELSSVATAPSWSLGFHFCSVAMNSGLWCHCIPPWLPTLCVVAASCCC